MICLLQTYLETKLYRVLNVFQRFFLCFSLAHAAWNRWTLNNPNAIFINSYRQIASHRLVLTDISFDNIHECVDALVCLG